MMNPISAEYEGIACRHHSRQAPERLNTVVAAVGRSNDEVIGDDLGLLDSEEEQLFGSDWDPKDLPDRDDRKFTSQQPWSSGHDACPTRRRSPVQSWLALLAFYMQQDVVAVSSYLFKLLNKEMPDSDG
eukprot:3214176-Amphidinium_carterae.1